MRTEVVVLDANLLVLLAVGTASRRYIGSHKRLRAYTVADFDLLVAFLSNMRRIVVTPNTVTEASNLMRQTAEPARTGIGSVFHRLLSGADEIYIESKRAAEHVAFYRLGIADTALLNVMAPGRILLTADLDLYLEVTRNGHDAINFNYHIEANR